MRRRTLIKTLAASPLTLLGGASSSDEARVLQLESDAESLRRLYHGANSPQDLLGLVSNHLDATVDLLRHLADGPLKRRVLRNRGAVATLAGRLTFFDLQQPTFARGYYGLAQEAAALTEDPLLSAAALGHLSFIPAAEGSTTMALDYLAAAMDHARRGNSPSFQSWVGAVSSEVLTTSDPGAALRALDQAGRALGAPVDTEAPSWFDYYSADRLDGFRGRALLQLGRHDEAREHLGAALEGLAPHAVKQRAVFLLDVASTHLSPTDPHLDRACDLAVEAARCLAAAGYATGGARLQEFRTQLTPWRYDSAVTDLEERLAELTR